MKFLFIQLTLIAFVLSLSAHSYSAPKNIFPGKKWPTVSMEDAGFSRLDFEKVVSYAFDPLAFYETHSLLVIKDGQIAYEKHAHNFSRNQPHRLWSTTKSFVSAMMGVAWGQGLFKLDDKMVKHFPSLEGKVNENMTVRHLMDMSSGFNWAEIYEKGDPLKSDVVHLLYLEGSSNMPKFLLEKPGFAPAGTRFNYSTGDSMLLMSLLRKVIKTEKAYQDFPWTALFNKIGITTATFEQDALKNYAGGAYLFVSPLDMARLGLLYQRNGLWKGNQIIPKKWIQMSNTPSTVFSKDPSTHNQSRRTYSMQWWLNKDIPQLGITKAYDNMPEDALIAIGHHGQYIISLPTQNIVIVRTGTDKRGSINPGRLTELLLNAQVPQ